MVKQNIRRMLDKQRNISRQKSVERFLPARFASQSGPNVKLEGKIGRDNCALLPLVPRALVTLICLNFYLLCLRQIGPISLLVFLKQSSFCQRFRLGPACNKIKTKSLKTNCVALKYISIRINLCVCLSAISITLMHILL